jgi:glyoxylase-like metal-dependent hydrolase (beta-lactamase superfamily II)
MPGWVVLETPGHTPGHISLYRQRDRVLLAGDAFCTTKPESFFDATVSIKPELHGPPAYFTSDWEAARASVEKLARLDPAVVAPGHGRPLSGRQLPQELRALAAEFRDVAVPENRHIA